MIIKLFFSKRLHGWALLVLVLSARSEGAVFTSQLVTNLPVVSGAPCSSDPSAGAAMGGYFYFAASDGTNGATGRELWRTDGTSGGTTLVKDILPGAAGSSPDQIVAAGTNIYFVANDGTHGRELWRSDGTAAGTYLVADLNPGPADSTYWIEASGDAAYFSQSTGQIGASADLFRTDGTPSGLFRLTGPGGVVSTNHLGLFDVVGTEVVLQTRDYDSTTGQTNTLWRFTGTGGFFTYALLTLSQSISSLHVVGESCCFVVSSNYTVISPGFTNTYYLQKLLRTSLLTSGGPAEEVDRSPASTGSSYLDGLSVANSRLYYSWSYGSGAGAVYGPFFSVGSSGSPVQVEPSGTGALPIIASIGGYVYYQDYSGPNSDALRRTDGFSAGVQVVDFVSLGLYPGSFTQAGSRLFFTDYNSGLLGVSDLSQAGTTVISNSVPGAPGYINRLMGGLGNALLYSEDDGLNGVEPHYSDGTTNGTFLVKDIAPGTDALGPLEAVSAAGLVFFTLPTTGSLVELWRSDGTPSGTLRLKPDLLRDLSGKNQLTACSNLVFFSSDDGVHGVELWRSDGSSGGTFLVKDVRPGVSGSNPSELTGAESQLFFVADDGSHGAELWRSDGTDAGTYMLQDLNPGVGAGNIRALAATGDRVHFIAGPNSTSGQLWYSTGQPGGTQFLVDFGTFSDASFWPRGFVQFGPKVYFGVGPYYGPVLYSTDDTPAGTTSVAMGGYEISAAGGILYVTGPPAVYASGAVLLKSDGTGSGTVLLTNLPTFHLTPVETTLYFLSGTDLWATDGTTNGTMPQAHASASLQGPTHLTPFQGTLVFTDDAPLLGQELWAIAPGQPRRLIEDLGPQAGDAGIQFVCAGTNQIFYLARPSGQPLWQLRSLRLQSTAPPPEGPFGGVPWPVPGRIEAEDFDTGGAGQAYSDSTMDNEGGQYRPLVGVDIEQCNDTGGGFCLFQTRAGEWVQYTINPVVDGMYQLDVRLTSQVVNTGFFRFESGGDLLSEYAVLNDGTPGGWFTETTTVALKAGPQILRLYFESPTSAGDVGLINWFNFTLLQTNLPPVVSLEFPPYGGILSTSQPVMLQATVVDPTTGAAPTVSFFVDGQEVGTADAHPYSTSWVPTPGPHTAYAVATDSFGATGTSSNVLFFVAQPIVDTGSFWRVNAFGTNVPSSWRQPGYDDSKWPRVRSSLGFGYPDIRTLLPSNYNNSPIPTYYFRQAISNDLSTFNFASITLTRDDAAVVYINGQQLARIDLPNTGLITFTNLALTNVVNNTTTRTNAAVDVIPVPLSMLVNGTNVIAVEVHQGLPGRDLFDLKFDLAFSTYSYTPAPTLTIQWMNTSLAVRWPDTLTNWTLEQSSDLVNWSPVSSIPSPADGFFTLLLDPPFAAKQFFRLRGP